MDKGMSMQTELFIKEKKQTETGYVTRAAMFASSKVIEVSTVANENWYLIYYKNHFINGVKLTHIEEDTFIHKTFTNGIVIESPNPLLSAFIPHKAISIPMKNKLFSQLQLHFSLQEVAYIATTLDSFFMKDEIISLIDKVYFHFRRSGKFMKSYQVIRILNDFAPSLKSAKERLESQEFNAYHGIYKSSDFLSILKKDPLFVELYCFNHRFNPEERRVVEDILSQHDALAAVLLWLEDIHRKQDTVTIEKYTNMALQYITLEEWMLVLGQVNINPFAVLPESKSLVEKMAEKGRVEQAALSIFAFINDLPSSYDAVLKTIWENSEPRFVLSHLDKFVELLQHLPRADRSRQMEEKIFQLAVNLFEEHELSFVQEQLVSIQELIPESEVIRKVKDMVQLEENPDRMMDVGDLYAEFKQYDKAIDCYFWEMELEPRNPLPVRKISKMYQLKGLNKEAASYQKLFEQLKSNQTAG